MKVKNIMRALMIIVPVLALFFILVCLPFFCNAGDNTPQDKQSSDVVDASRFTGNPSQAKNSEYDFSDDSSWNLTVSAWEKLAEKDYAGVFAYAEKCIGIYGEEADKTASGMRNFAGPGHEDDYAVVNDVATAYYIMGETYMREEKYDRASEKFETVIKKYPYAQCWDPKGWFWKVSEVSAKNLEKITRIKQEKNIE